MDFADLQPGAARNVRIIRLKLSVPQRAREELERSERARFRGEFEESVRRIKRAIEIFPDYSDALNNLGTHYHSQLAIDYFYLHDYAEAKKYFKKVLVLDPAAANSPQLFLAHIALSEKNEPEAEGYIRGFLALHPNSPHAPRLRSTLETLASKSQSSSSLGQAQP